MSTWYEFWIDLLFVIRKSSKHQKPKTYPVKYFIPQPQSHIRYRPINRFTVSNWWENHISSKPNRIKLFLIQWFRSHPIRKSWLPFERIEYYITLWYWNSTWTFGIRRVHHYSKTLRHHSDSYGMIYFLFVCVFLYRVSVHDDGNGNMATSFG